MMPHLILHKLLSNTEPLLLLLTVTLFAEYTVGTFECPLLEYLVALAQVTTH